MNALSWENIDQLSDSEISYLLYSEGKSINAICKIRNMQKTDIEKQIIECKIKYRVFEGSSSTDDIVKKLVRCGRDERKSIIAAMPEDEKIRLESHAIKKLFSSNRDECSFYIWLLGEFKSICAIPSIITFLKCSDGNIKRMCCSALGKIGDIRAEDALISCLKDSKPQVKEYAVKSLGKIKSKKALPYLYDIINKGSEKEYIIRASKIAVSHIEEKGDDID